MAQRYIVAMSATDTATLRRHAGDLVRYLAVSRSGAGRWDGVPADLASIVKTLQLRPVSRVRLSFLADSVEQFVTRLALLAQHDEQPAGVHMCDAAANPLANQRPEVEDYEYLATLLIRDRHDQVARLWASGLEIHWRRLYPELRTLRPTYLPPTRALGRAYRPEPEPDASPARPAADPAVVAAAAPVPAPVAPNPPPAVVSTPGGWVDQPKPVRHRFFREFLQTRIARVLDYAGGTVPATDTGFFDLGMTSIDLQAVREEIVAEFAFTPPDTAAFDHPTITTFAAYLADAALPAAVPTPATGPPLRTLSHTEIAQLSPDDLERVLADIV